MSGENNQGLTIDIDSINNSEENGSQKSSKGSFILASPTVRLLSILEQWIGNSISDFQKDKIREAFQTL